MTKNIVNKVNWFVNQYKSLVVMAVYAVIYLIVFGYLENRQIEYNIINLAIDRRIPFCEYFVIPYFLWFAYVAVTVCIVCIFDKVEAEKLVPFLIAGMTIFLVVSAVYPNGLALRPKYFARDNFCVDLVKYLYTIDTSTNVIPSIHVYKSIAIMIVVWRSKIFENHGIIKALMLILGASIIVSTVMIKQHSMLDVMVALVLSVIMYPICYKRQEEYAYRKV